MDFVVTMQGKLLGVIDAEDKEQIRRTFKDSWLKAVTDKNWHMSPYGLHLHSSDFTTRTIEASQEDIDNALGDLQALDASKRYIEFNDKFLRIQSLEEWADSHRAKPDVVYSLYSVKETSNGTK